MSTAFRIAPEQGDIVIRLPKGSVDEEQLMALLDYLELETMRRRSELSSEDAERLARDVNQGAWQQVRDLFEPSCD